MSAIGNKFHIKIGDFGFLLAKGARTERHIYARQEAPSFVNKFSSGDPNYRDATFFPHFVQLNWQNGFNQEFFDDGGKYYRSTAVDPTVVQKLTLQKKFSLAGSTIAGISIRTQEAWRASATSFFGESGAGAKTVGSDEDFNATNGYLIDSGASGSIGSTVLTATNAGFTAGQWILIHQTRGASAGINQKNKILSYSSGTIQLQDPLNIEYKSSGNDVAQVLVLKEYDTFTVSAGKVLSADQFDGTRGGIIAFLVNGTTTVTGNISGDGKGYRGGAGGSSGSSSGEGTVGPSVAASAASNGTGGGGSSASGGGAGAGGGLGTAGTDGSGGSSNGTGGIVGGNVLLTQLLMGGGGGGGNDGSNGAGGNGGAIIWIGSKIITVTGGIHSNGAAGASANASGGGGAGGSILLKTQSGTGGTNLIVATGGAGGTGGYAVGGAGGVGRIHNDYLTSVISGTTNPTLDSLQDGTLADTPAGSSFTHIIGAADGKIYSWDGASIYTEIFDTRRLEWFETGTDVDKIVGDVATVETAQAQSFQTAVSQKMAAVQLYLKLGAGTPGDITVRIETESSSKPSGTLVNANATATIPAFTTAAYGWVTVNFSTAFDLTGATKYWIVIKTAAAADDNNYKVAAKSTTGYANGNAAHSDDGGSTWTADSGIDLYFRVLGNPTSINCSLVSDITGTSKMYFGVGNREAIVNGDARIYSYNGTTFTLVKTFNSTNESSVLCMKEYGTSRKMYIGMGHKAKIYTTTDFSTFTLAKTINVPNNPGYIFDMEEYNGRLYVGGGFPEQLYGNNTQYSGFLFAYDEFAWIKVGEFEHTVITSLEVFDTLLFIGTIKKRLYVFNTASIDKLFEFPWDIQISDMRKWDDKLALAITPTPGSSPSGFEGIYLFDRNGFHNAFSVSTRIWYSVFVFNNNLMAGNDQGEVYQTSPNLYQANGSMQTSYEEAQLPSIYKLRHSVTLQYESLLTGTSLQIEYKTDESDASWTNLGTANIVGSTEATFAFAPGVFSKKISFRVNPATTVPANTPTLKKILHKYVLSPDFKYLWKMNLACVDNIIWQDHTQPVAKLKNAVTAGDTSITFVDTEGNTTPTEGFVDPAGSTMYACIINPDTGVRDNFTYTGKTNNTLTGIPSTGQTALLAHAVGSQVKISGANLHKKILDLKQERKLWTLTDIDGLTYQVLFHQYDSDSWSINQDDFYGGLENEVPITLLES